MRPTINETAAAVDTEYGSIPWDEANNRPLDPDGEAGRLYVQALTDNGMMEPDPPVPPLVPVPNEIFDFQFAAALMTQGVISAAEASAFVKVGDIPATLQAAIDAIPDPQARALAELRVSGATTYRRDHPLTLALATALGWSSEQVDELWRAGAAL